MASCCAGGCIVDCTCSSKSPEEQEGLSHRWKCEDASQKASESTVDKVDH